MESKKLFTKFSNYLNNNKQTVLAFLIVFILACVSRLILLDSRPVHHDEGMLAYFAWKLADLGQYDYTPQIHAPILFYVEALIFKLIGTSSFALRLGPAIFGIILSVLPFFVYGKKEKPQAIFTSILILTSPLFLYYSRFLVHTSMVVVFWLLFVFALRNFFKTYKNLYVYLSFIWLSVAFCISETTYIFLAIILALPIIWSIVGWKSFSRFFGKFSKYLKENITDFLSAILVFILIWIIVYSVGLSNFKSLIVSVPNPFDPDSGLGFWLVQHPKKLGGQHWYYYLTLLLVYEPIILFGFIAGVVDSLKKRWKFYLFLSWIAVGTLFAFSFAGEKFPWLLLCPLILITILAGYFYGTNWKKFHISIKVIIIVLALFSAFMAFRLNYFSSYDTNELAVYVQTPQEAHQIFQNVAKECERQGQKCVYIDQSITWPMSWYFKDKSTLYPAGKITFDSSTKYIFVPIDKISKDEIPKDFELKKFYLRDWWVPQSCGKFKCAQQYLGYFFSRQTWNGKGGYEIYLLKHK